MEVGHTQEDACCEICGSSDFQELICKCCECRNCSEHVYCMTENLRYIPDMWTCEECLLINSSCYDPMSGAVGEDEKTLVEESNIHADVSNFDDQEEKVQPPTEMDVAFESHLENLVKKLFAEASGDNNSDASCKSALLQDSVMANADAKPEAQMELIMIPQEVSVFSDINSHSKGQCSSLLVLKDTHSPVRVKDFPKNASDAANSASHSEEQGINPPPQALYIDQECKDSSKALKVSSSQPLHFSKNASSDLSMQFDTEQENTDRLARKMKRLGEELHSLWKKIDNARRNISPLISEMHPGSSL